MQIGKAFFNQKVTEEQLNFLEEMLDKERWVVSSVTHPKSYKINVAIFNGNYQCSQSENSNYFVADCTCQFCMLEGIMDRRKQCPQHISLRIPQFPSPLENGSKLQSYIDYPVPPKTPNSQNQKNLPEFYIPDRVAGPERVEFLPTVMDFPLNISRQENNMRKCIMVNGRLAIKFIYKNIGEPHPKSLSSTALAIARQKVQQADFGRIYVIIHQEMIQLRRWLYIFVVGRNWAVPFHFEAVFY